MFCIQKSEINATADPEVNEQGVKSMVAFYPSANGGWDYGASFQYTEAVVNFPFHD